MPGVPPPPQLSGDAQVPQLAIAFPQLSTPGPHCWPPTQTPVEMQLHEPLLQVFGAVQVPQLIVLPQLSVPVPQV